MQQIKKAVLPVAGLGTRFLPATKASPKEMLAVVDKPLVQYAAEEAVAAGCDTLIFVYGRNKGAIVDHFDMAYELETELLAKGKLELLNSVRAVLPSHVSCVFIRQSQAMGLGHAVMCAQPVVGDEPFAVLLADDLMMAKTPVLKQMVEVYEQRQASVLGIQAVAADQVSSYGIIDGELVDARTWRVDSIVEKPSPDQAPSNQAVVGRYVFAGGLFQKLAQIGRGAGGEIQLTDAIADLLEEQAFYGHVFEGRRFDCGSKLGFLQANLAFGLEHPELGESFSALVQAEMRSRA